MSRGVLDGPFQSKSCSDSLIRYSLELKESSYHFWKATKRDGLFVNRLNLTIQELIPHTQKCRYLQTERSSQLQDHHWEVQSLLAQFCARFRRKSNATLGWYAWVLPSITLLKINQLDSRQLHYCSKNCNYSELQWLLPRTIRPNLPWHLEWSCGSSPEVSCNIVATSTLLNSLALKRGGHILNAYWKWSVPRLIPEQCLQIGWKMWSNWARKLTRYFLIMLKGRQSNFGANTVWHKIICRTRRIFECWSWSLIRVCCMFDYIEPSRGHGAYGSVWWHKVPLNYMY